MNETVLNSAMIASIIIGYFVGIALVTTSFYRSRANNYLALSLFLIASITFLELPSIDLNITFFQVLILFRFDFLFGATLFIYFLIQTKHDLLNDNRYKLLFLPFVISVLAEISLYAFDLYGSVYDILIFFLKDPLSIIFNVFLIIWGRRLVHNSSTISEDKRHWLLRMNLFIICIIVCWISSRFESLLFDSLYSAYAMLILLSFFSWWILYYGVFRLQVIAQKEEIHEYLISKKTPVLKADKKIKSATTSKVMNQLYQLMDEEELYKNPLLSRLELATLLGTSEGYLSQIINQEINKSVVQFVNEYRIGAAKDLLHNPIFNKYSVEAIGMEAGFKSKSAFYSAFNMSLKMSPGAYRKLQKTS